jgi:hypothetical protein
VKIGTLLSKIGTLLSKIGSKLAHFFFGRLNKIKDLGGQWHSRHTSFHFFFFNFKKK